MNKNEIVHIEIPATDLKGSGRFYDDLFGWKVEEIPEMDYVIFEAGEGPGGGFNNSPMKLRLVMSWCISARMT